MMSLSRLATRSLFRAFAISDSVIVFRIVSGIGNGSGLVKGGGDGPIVGSSVGFFLPNRISCVRSWNGALEPFPRKRSIPLVITRDGWGAGLL